VWLAVEVSLLLFHLSNSVHIQRVCISEADVVLVWGSAWRNLVQELDHSLSLLFGPHLDGGTASDRLILLYDLGSAALGYQGTQPP